MELVTLEVLVIVFFGAIVIDFITGILVSAKKGKLKSRTCSDGMFRSIGECIVLSIFIAISKLIPNLNLILSTFVIGFIFKEGLSIVENLVGLDVWIPNSIKKMLEVGIDKIDKLEEDK
jgi:toxin secretion/phage lysis holin